MKKICVLLTLLISSVCWSQTAPTNAAKSTVTVKEVKQTVQAAKPTVPLKKDGTPDKRFKENKTEKPAVPLKKDGTPDKRFKENKKKS